MNDLLLFREETVDANQSWTDTAKAIRFSNELVTCGCVLIEQPFHKADLVLTKELKESLAIPIIADESCQSLADIERCADSFSGINIKLQKCGGLSAAMRMIDDARKRDLKILMGCMSESSIGCGAAEVLTPLCDWADLDGPWLISNNDEIKKRIQKK